MILKGQFFTMTKSAKGNQFFVRRYSAIQMARVYSLMFDNIYASGIFRRGKRRI